ncbi:GIY-YIG nuclease family protein [Candidatus Pelagibacter sp.]|nr:GIY-YIG nuclease family protein [Candidatus Pelagibacter sp.]
MSYYVYLIISKGSKKNKSYVGYTKDLKKRIALHNSNKGAKSTKGYYWEILYKKDFKTKSEAMSFEYRLKKNRKLRKRIISKK